MAKPPVEGIAVALIPALIIVASLAQLFALAS